VSDSQLEDDPTETAQLTKEHLAELMGILEVVGREIVAAKDCWEEATGHLDRITGGGGGGGGGNAGE